MLMKIKSTVLLSLIVIISASAFLVLRNEKTVQHVEGQTESENNESSEKRALYNRLRALREFNMVKDPVTNKIPKNISELEVQQALSIPLKDYGNPLARGGNLNTYIPAGPNNIGGRTRAVAFDKRNSNIIIAGCISGGIYRSTDGGANWTRVTPQGEIHNFSTVAQDPRAGFEDTWYAGGGEPIANSASGPFAFYLSEGVWKSTNNGQTWTRLPLTVPGLGNGTLEGFDHPFDIIHKIVVHPVNGNVYVAGHRRLIRSLNGGNAWEIAFNTSAAAGSANGQMDIAIASTGKLILGVNGGMPDVNARGVWTSSSGAIGTWTRIAGGPTLGIDSVAEWRGNDYSSDPSKRILLGLAPSNQNLLYVLYENGSSQSATTPAPEVDMYKLDITAAAPVWTNLSANMPDFPGNREGVDPIAVQGGYNMLVAVKPDNPDVVFVGGTCLYRSTNGFASTAATAWIAGYGNTLPTLTLYPNSHPDIHSIAFDPSNANRSICGNDGGIQVTTNIMSTVTAQEPVTWTMIRNYQTLQYYHVALDPGSGRNNFMGGSQDNGTHFRFDGNNDHFRVVGGDGGASGMAKVSGSNQIIYCSSQLGDMYRATLNGGSVTAFNNIKPTGLTATPGGGFGDFVTYFKIDFDNPEDAYYVNFNRLFRTTNASTVASSGWTELTGVGSAVNPSNPTGGTNIIISALETSRGDYFPSHSMYIGTSSGKIFRLDNPRNAAGSAAPIDITPPLPANTYISDIASNPNNDEEIIAVVSNYTVNNNPVTNIWWTNNAKSSTPTWKAAEGNLTLPSIRSAQIIVKKDASNNPVTEYYVGTSVGLYSAVNIGPTLLANQAVNWVREGDNVLNLAVVTTLDYRPVDNIFLVGTHGNGMYYANAGTPNYTPNLNTGVVDPVRNDKHFIEVAYPTIVRNQKINYKIGNMFTVKGIVVQVYSNSGQLLFRKESSYTNGSVDTERLPKGSYILTITSNDYKQQFVQSFVKN